MDKIWISALTGALTGGFISFTCVLLFGMPLWGLLVIYPAFGIATTATIYGIWSHLETQKHDTQDAVVESFVNMDKFV